jgi:hypothetical protein
MGPWRTVKIILIFGAVGGSPPAIAMELGVHAAFMKPLAPEELRSAIRRTLFAQVCWR